MKVLFVDDNPEIRELLIFTLSSQANFEYKEASGGHEAVSLLKQGEKFDYIITDLNMPEGSGMDVYLYVRDNLLTCRMAVVATELPGKLQEDPLVYFLKKPFTFEDLQSFMDELSERNQVHDPRHYVPVTLNLLRRINRVNVPLFIRLNDQKFVKLTSGVTEFNQAEYERYHQRGVSELFVELMFADTLVEEFSKRAFSKDAWQDSAGADLEKIHINAELVRMICQHLGSSEQKVHEIISTARRALTVIRSQHQLKEIFSQFQKIEKWGIADHSALALTIAAGLADLLGHGDEETMKKLAFVSLLHDMTLTERQYDNKHKLVSRLATRPSDLNKDEKDMLDHPAKAAQFCKSLAVCPPGVDEIIFQHHERPDGSGFPMGKKADELQLLSALFIFAEDFTHAFIASLGRQDIHAYLRSREGMFNAGYFKMIFEAFKTCTEEKVQMAS